MRERSILILQSRYCSRLVQKRKSALLINLYRCERDLFLCGKSFSVAPTQHIKLQGYYLLINISCRYVAQIAFLKPQLLIACVFCMQLSNGRCFQEAVKYMIVLVFWCSFQVKKLFPKSHGQHYDKFYSKKHNQRYNKVKFYKGEILLWIM